MKKIKYTTLLIRIIFLLLILIVPYEVYSRTERKQLSKLFLSHSVSRDFNESYRLFSESMKGRLNTTQFQTIWENVYEQYGELVFRRVTKEEETNGGHHVVLFSAFKNGSVDIHLHFNSRNEIEHFFFAPGNVPDEYTPPRYDYPEFYRKREVTVQTGNYRLPGTFYYPSSGSNIPVVVLIHGSGFHDRYSTIGPNKPFRDIAVGMAAFGVGVLCFDKRTYKYPDIVREKEMFTVNDEIIKDALTAIDLARRLPESDPENIFLLGHGFGGMIAPRIASSDQGIAGIIKMAANARSLEDVILEQVRYQSMLEEKSEHMDDILKLYEFQVMRVKRGDFSDLSHSDLPMNYPPSYWIDLGEFDHIEYSRNTDKPVLVLRGERDYQVTGEDFSIWERELEEKDNVSFISFPGLNHLMMPGISRSTPTEYEYPGNVAIDVILDLVEWVTSISGSR